MPEQIVYQFIYDKDETTLADQFDENCFAKINGEELRGNVVIAKKLIELYGGKMPDTKGSDKIDKKLMILGKFRITNKVFAEWFTFNIPNPNDKTDHKIVEFIHRDYPKKVRAGSSQKNTQNRN